MAGFNSPTDCSRRFAMKRNELYRQCRLVKKIRGGEAIQMSYIPAEFAREGRIVKLREDDGGWDDGWVIRVVGESLTADQLTALELGRRRLERHLTKA
jgi:hypothetical protein